MQSTNLYDSFEQMIDPLAFYHCELAIQFNNSNLQWLVAGLCPFHDDQKPGSFYINTASGSFKCFSCGHKGSNMAEFVKQRYSKTYPEAADYLKQYYQDIALTNPPKQSRAVQPYQSQQTPAENTKFRRQLNRNRDLWQKAKPITANDHTSKYLNNRITKLNVSRLPPALRSGYDAYYENGNRIGRYPCMLARVTNNNGRCVALHRTYLTPHGRKANVTNPKKLTANLYPNALHGAAIRLYQPFDELAVTEGIETAMAVHALTQIPTWAAISSNGLAKVDIPAHIKTLHIFADNDRSGAGQKAALLLKERLQNTACKAVIYYPCHVLPPKRKSYDWLDFWQDSWQSNCNPSERFIAQAFQHHKS